MKVKSESEVAQSCPTLSDPMDCSLTGSSVHGLWVVGNTKRSWGRGQGAEDGGSGRKNKEKWFGVLLLPFFF